MPFIDGRSIMSIDPRPAPKGWRSIARAGLALAGLVAIVGSGGGLGIDWCGDGCGFDIGAIPPAVSIDPQRVTAQVGTAVSFDAVVVSFAGGGSARLQWCRRDPGAGDCIDIAGATERRYTLASANLADDGAQFELRAVDDNGTGQDRATLAVSSAPPVVFADVDFAQTDWAAAAIPAPVPGGPGAAVAREAVGGNPDAFRSVTYALPGPAGAIRVFHASLAAAYDPATQGAVYVVDFALDCVRTRFEGSAQVPVARPTIEQAGRRYVPMPPGGDGWAYCGPSWAPAPALRSVAAGEFVLVDGPACAAGEACPDFSAQAAPIRLGFETAIDVGVVTSPVTVVQGIDNWRVAVWRR
jgi:hypothetical protein